MATQNIVNTRIQFRRDLAANWAAVADKVTPAPGEPCFETDTGVFKIGDGVTTVINLPFQKTNINDLKAVSYDVAQELTDEQKTQARTNIGAGEPQV
jgi:hypothetical protein